MLQSLGACSLILFFNFFPRCLKVRSAVVSNEQTVLEKMKNNNSSEAVSSPNGYDLHKFNIITQLGSNKEPPHRRLTFQYRVHCLSVDGISHAREKQFFRPLWQVVNNDLLVHGNRLDDFVNRLALDFCAHHVNLFTKMRRNEMLIIKYH